MSTAPPLWPQVRFRVPSPQTAHVSPQTPTSLLAQVSRYPQWPPWAFGGPTLRGGGEGGTGMKENKLELDGGEGAASGLEDEQ
jgi:hypothetical protein